MLSSFSTVLILSIIKRYGAHKKSIVIIIGTVTLCTGGPNDP